MALNLGELVAGLRADEAPFTRSLNAAELRMRGLTRDVNGQLRDINGNFVSASRGMGQSLSHAIGMGAREAVKALKGVGIAAAGLGVGLPAIAAVTAGLMGIVAAGAAAGIAVKAFSLAATPQMEQVTEVSKLAEEAQKAHAAGAEDAAEKQKAYADALRALPPATEATARAFIGMKKDYKSWSDSLASTTMPVFTKGIQILRDLLPTLTPFVQAAATAIGGFLDKVAVGVKSAAFKEWAADMAAAAGPALSDFLEVIKNLAVGFGGLLQAFLPASAGMTGGLVSMSEAFANWATSLKGSEGFARFLEMASAGGDTLGSLASAAVQLLVALGPLIGITTQLATWLAKVISATPTPVLTALATVIGTVTVAMKLWAIAQALVAARNRIWTATQWQLNASMFASPIFWVIAAVVALIAIIVLIATKTTWFQTAWEYTWNAIKAVTAWVVSAVGATLAWFGTLPGKFAGWIGAAKDWVVTKFTEMVAWVRGVPGRIGAALGSLLGVLRSSATNAFNAFRAAAVSRATAFVSWVAGLPGRISRGIGSLSGLLVSKGKDVIRGLWNGIKSMGSWLKNQLIGFAKGMIPGPIAKALGISSPSKLMADQIGRWIPAGVAQGVTANAGVLDKAMSNLVTTPTPSMAMGMGAGVGAAVGGAGRGVSDMPLVRVDLGGQLGDALVEALREKIGIGGGDVQLYLGKRK
ncbi:phage tail protein [Streptomyces phaeochromogenes]